jgi:hypothetical protein
MTGFMCGASYANLADGVVAYWSFDAGTAEDDGGMGNHGTIFGDPKVADGKVGEAFDFDGIDDGIEVPDNPNLRLPDTLTVAAWIRPDKYVKYGGICWKGKSIEGVGDYNWRIASSCKVARGLYWGTATGEDESMFLTWNGTALEEWNFVALTADGEKTIGYSAKGGVGELTSVSQSSPGPYDVWEGEPVRIGFSTGSRFDGAIDEVVIYSRVLSEVELTQLMNEGLSMEEMTVKDAVEPATAVDPHGKLARTWASLRARD